MSQSILRNGLTSPARALMGRPTQRSILKRPASLAVSPSANMSFSIMVSGSPSAKSPHVHFMKSPQLVATFVTHSSDTYDRAPIKVSPNSLSLPDKHSRYFSPTLDQFKLAPPPPPKAAALKRLNSILKASQCASPAITDFPDPRSPQPDAVPSFQQTRFASFAAAPTREPRELALSIGSYPRSPYPSAPLSPRSAMDTEVDGRLHSLSSAPAAPSPLQASFKSPGLHRAHKPAPLALESAESTSSLSNAFWNSMTLGSGETPMVTALEYPESANAMEEVALQSPSFVKSPGVKSPMASLMFGIHDGSVWAPSAPAKKATPAREELLRNTLMSPAKAAFAQPRKVTRAIIASPSPNDPFASFPSFAAALSLDQSTMPVTVPSRVLLERA